MTKWTTVEEAVRALPDLECKRLIRFVVLHGTWRPNHAQWHGDASCHSMVDWWLAETKKRKWKNPLGAQFVVAPDGTIYQPFSLSTAVNSSSDLTVNRASIAIETVGDFDRGHDTLGATQAHALYGLTGALLARFELPREAVRFHREFNASKTCPGTSFDREESRERAAAGKTWARQLWRFRWVRRKWLPPVT